MGCCYFGCAGNRVRWTGAVVAFLLAVVCWVVAVVVRDVECETRGAEFAASDVRCVNSDEDVDVCAEIGYAAGKYEADSGLESWAPDCEVLAAATMGSLYGAAFFFILMGIPCCQMCFCARRPSEKASEWKRFDEDAGGMVASCEADFSQTKKPQELEIVPLPDPDSPTQRNTLLTQRLTLDLNTTSFHTSQVPTHSCAPQIRTHALPFSVRPEFEALHNALDSMERSQTPLYGRFRKLSAVDRRAGGQGLVQFVLDVEQSRSCAVKFFLHRSAFEHERCILTDPALREAVTDGLLEVFENSDGRHRAPDGYVLPPSIVMERGQSLNEWLRGARPHLATIVDAMLGVVRRLRVLHDAGYVHRDIKPGNLIRIVSQREHGWALIDFGSTAKAGEVVPLSFSLKYAAPETLSALERGANAMEASPAVDIWAVGVIALELITYTPVFPPHTSAEEVHAAIVGRAPLPWEQASGQSSELLFALKGMKRTVLQSLSRDAGDRPTAAQLVHSWEHMFDGETTMSARSELTASSAAN